MARRADAGNGLDADHRDRPELIATYCLPKPGWRAELWPWRNSGMGDWRYWGRLRGFRGILADIIANDFTDATSIVHIGAGDVGFCADPDCGTWTKIG